MRIIEDEDAYEVQINDIRIKGFVDDKKCNCGNFRIYNAEFDAFFCPCCNEWLERKCTDPDCEYCGSRPGKPL